MYSANRPWPPSPSSPFPPLPPVPQEQAAREEQDPKDRALNFVPKAHACLRHVAGYDNFVKERFERCLDLYLCPRKLKRCARRVCFLLIVACAVQPPTRTSSSMTLTGISSP